MADIGRSGCTKSGVVDAVAGPLRHISPRIEPASSSSVAPSRSGPRRSDSAVREQAVAHLAVGGEPHPVAGARRTGALTLAMTPTVSGPPSTRNRSAGACPGARRQRCQRRTRSDSALEDLVRGDHRSRGPAVLGVERHLLDEPQLVAALEAPGQQVGDLVVVDAAHRAPR